MRAPTSATTPLSTASQQVSLEGSVLSRRLRVGGASLRSSVVLPDDDDQLAEAARQDPLGAWWKAYLCGIAPEPDHGYASPPATVRTVDLFAGAGGMTLGVRLLASEVGHRVASELAVDTDADALAVHARNHRTRRLSAESVASLVDYRIRGVGAAATFEYPPELLDDQIASACADVDVLLAGPPCQGHSNLNNHSRRSDRRNLLYLTVPAFAVACRARVVMIENVTSVIHDEAQVVQTTRALLEAWGYAVMEGVLAADAMGWPQTRRRHFLVARRIAAAGAAEPLPLDSVQAALSDSPARSVLWAIGGQQPLSRDQALHAATDLTPSNRDRIRWLFENDEHDLALAERPDCHQQGTSYGAVYGRMHADRPAPTITTGLMTPGRGRFVHPTEPRTLTPAEAARLQGFPDDYRFRPAPDRPPGRSQLAKWIGDAVAMPLGYAAALAALAPDIARASANQ